MYYVVSTKTYKVIAETRKEELANMIALISEEPCEIIFNNWGK